VIPDENGVEVRPNRSLADYIAPKGTKPTGSACSR
jgi:hypothetical protein